jgi:predicted Rossmann-fold nucleotide-binding protein
VWAQLVLGIHAKPVMLLNHNLFWDPLLAMVEQMSSAGFLRPHEHTSLTTISSAAELFDVLDRWIPPEPRWAAQAWRATELETI